MQDVTLSLRELLATPRGVATVAAELVAVVAMLPFIVMERGTIEAYSLKGWLDVWNGLDLSIYFLQTAIVAMHLGRFQLQSGALSVAAAVQTLLLLFKLQYYCRVFKSTRFAFLEAIRDVLSDAKFYLFFVLVRLCRPAAVRGRWQLSSQLPCKIRMAPPLPCRSLWPVRSV